MLVLVTVPLLLVLLMATTGTSFCTHHSHVVLISQPENPLLYCKMCRNYLRVSG